MLYSFLEGYLILVLSSIFLLDFNLLILLLLGEQLLGSRERPVSSLFPPVLSGYSQLTLCKGLDF